MLSMEMEYFHIPILDSPEFSIGNDWVASCLLKGLFISSQEGYTQMASVGLGRLGMGKVITFVELLLSQDHQVVIAASLHPDDLLLYLAQLVATDMIYYLSKVGCVFKRVLLLEKIPLSFVPIHEIDGIQNNLHPFLECEARDFPVKEVVHYVTC